MKEHEIDIRLCRGQSYDNASNMSGKYNGMQAHMKKENDLIDFFPCAGHSMNLIGESAVDCCVEAVSFFGLVQQIYNFFSGSTYRWSVLKRVLPEKILVPKSISETRWSANAEAVKAFHQGYSYFCMALEELSNDASQTTDTRRTAKNLSKSMELLETRVLIQLWDAVLQPFDRCSHQLQSPKLDLQTAVSLLKSLEGVLERVRNSFGKYEEEARDMKFKMDFNKRKRGHDDSQDASNAFRVNTFFVILDKLQQSLEERISKYNDACYTFSIYCNFSDTMQAQEVEEGVQRLCQKYPDDLPNDFTEEFLQFINFTSMIKMKKDKNESTCLWLYRIIMEAEVTESFPNVEISLKILLCQMITNCSGERSFSALKRIKNDQRSTMTQELLAALALLDIESRVVKTIDIDELINDFAAAKARKKYIY